MEYFFEFIGQILPALLVFLLAYFYMQRMDKGGKVPESNASNKEQIKIITPLRLQAYERLILMLERISPNALVMRLQAAPQTAGQMQLALLKSVREEFEHNISMQMYVSEEAWNLVEQSREEILHLINVAGSEVTGDLPGIDLSRKILEIGGQSQQPVWRTAILILRREVRQLYS